jgi:DNA (cytosine-5)-methyltransferase 1
MNQSLKYISLFSGVGGFDLALDRAGFQNVFCSEIDKYAVETYNENFNHPVSGDITQIDASDIPTHDILVGGFPCQAFSIAGHRKGFEETRGTLIFDVFRVLNHHKPKVFLLENVKGLLNHNKGKTFSYITTVLREIGYDVHCAVLNSKDFGLPQNRERVFIVGFSDFVDYFTFSFPRPTGIKTSVNDILEENVDEKYFLSDETIKYHLKRKEDNKAKGKGFGASFLTPSAYTTNTISARYGKDGSDALIKTGSVNNSQSGQIYSPSGLGVTLKALGGGQGAKTGLYDVNSRVRRLTPRECFRLQGFPDTFKLPCSDTQSYRQAGNSVSVPVIEAILKEIKHSIIGWK